MKTDVAVHLLGGEVRRHSDIPPNNIQFADGFLSIKEGKKVTSYAAQNIFLVEQEMHESS